MVDKFRWGDNWRGLDRQPGDQRTLFSGVAAPSLGVRHDEVVGRPGERHVQEPCFLRPVLERGRRSMRNQPGLDARHDDGVPFAPLGGVEREQFDADLAARLREDVARGDPRTEFVAVAVGLLPQELQRSCRDLAFGLFAGGHRGTDGRRRRLEHVVGPRPQLGCRSKRCSGRHGAGEWAPRRDRLLANCHASGDQRRVQRGQLLVGPGEHGHLAPAQQVRGVGGDEAADERRLGVLVGGAVDLDCWAVVTPRDGVATLAGRAQHVQSGRDDLGRRSAVRRESHDLDPGKVAVDVDEQRGVRTVEPVNRLRRVADQKQVVASGDELTKESELHRVEVLGLVDEDVTKSPADDLGEVSGRPSAHATAPGAGHRRR